MQAQLLKHYQVSTFEVECMDLSNRLPNPDECFQFVVPKSVLAGGYTIEVGGQIVISWSM
jgi:E3 ubiquitin-protein ligase SIAH1